MGKLQTTKISRKYYSKNSEGFEPFFNIFDKSIYCSRHKTSDLVPYQRGNQKGSYPNRVSFPSEIFRSVLNMQLFYFFRKDTENVVIKVDKIL